jgi:hypothetical protein
MSFISWQYFIFLPIIIISYWLLPARRRLLLLLAGSYFFYACWGQVSGRRWPGRNCSR